MKTRILLLTLSALLALAGLAPRAQAQAGTETLTVIDSSCTTAAPCTLQLYKATLAAGQTACPSTGATAYAALTTTQLGGSVGLVNTAWTYVDSVLGAGTTYCYYATVTYAAGGSASPPSQIFTAAIPVPTPSAAPTIAGTFAPAS